MEIMQHQLYSYKSKNGNQIQKFITILPHRQIQQREYRTIFILPSCVLYQISSRTKKSYIFIRSDQKIPIDITRRKEQVVYLIYLKYILLDFGCL